MPGVYISYPFCAQKCSFCNFASGPQSSRLQDRYIAALLSEIGTHRWNFKPDTVYVGGGTPSQLPVDALGPILRQLPGAPWLEATVEAAPGTITRDKAAGWRAAGIDRISLGVQSFVTQELRQTGRRHNAETVAAECRTLRDAGIENINLDLIAGLPHQTMESWNVSLDWIERLAPEHVSVYLLEVDEDSRLGLEILQGGSRYGAADIPDEDASADFYEIAVRRLRSMGIERYEISNFARPGFESKHNLKYWTLQPYAGFGADAHSFDGQMRRSNPESVSDYLENRSEASESPARPDQERLFTGLRLDQGIELSDDEWNRYGEALLRFEECGLVKRDGCHVRLTDRGVLLSSEVFQEFVGA